jgi:hypothetical protein
MAAFTLGLTVCNQIRAVFEPGAKWTISPAILILNFGAHFTTVTGTSENTESGVRLHEVGEIRFSKRNVASPSREDGMKCPGFIGERLV